MHIEKNVCESVIEFIIGVKDTFKVRRDMEVCGVREHLWLKRDPHNLGKHVMDKKLGNMKSHDWHVLM
jgi:hypothetical protein